MISSRYAPFVTGVAIALLALLSFSTQLIGLDDYVTTDEPFWLGRSANFYRALSDGDYDQTYQMAHPGVLTMWAGTVGYLMAMPDYPDKVDDNLIDQHFIHHLLLDLGQDPLEVLNAGRIAKIWLQAVFFAIALLYVERLFGLASMIGAGLLIALDPMLSGLGSILHLDGLFAITTLAALLSICHVWRHDPDRLRGWMVAGALAACAWLTRWTGLALILPMVLTLTLLAAQRRKDGASLPSAIGPSVKAAIAWLGAGALVSVVLWPALWADPGTVISEIWDWSSEAASSGHELPTYFRGVIYDGDPGWLFYPYTLAWRLTPVTLLGLVLFAGLAIVAVRRKTFAVELGAIGMMLLFALVFVVAMSLGAKKFDRYISPIYPILDLLAAIGFVGAATWAGRKGNLKNWAIPGVLVAIVALQGWALYSVTPYRLDYFNPLLGGATAAEQELQLGWGQAAKKTLDWIGPQASEDNPIVIQVSGSDGPFMYFLPAHVYLASNGITSIEGWCQSDYFIAGIQQWQREFSRGYRLVENHDPVMTVQVEGVDYFRVYEINDVPPPEEVSDQGTCPA